MAISSRDAQAIYNEVLHYGHIRPLLTEYEKAFFENNENPLNTVTDTELLSLAFDSKTASRREHSYDAYRPDEPWKIGDTVELARLTVPSGFLGIMRRIDTLVLDETTGEPISDWGNPDSWDNIFRFVVTYNVENDAVVGDRWINIPAAPLLVDDWVQWLQSNPLHPFTFWDDDRYAWGNPSNDIGVVLPKQIDVRLFLVCIENTEFRHAVKGRMVATIQLEESISAAWQARRGSKW